MQPVIVIVLFESRKIISNCIFLGVDVQLHLVGFRSVGLPSIFCRHFETWGIPRFLIIQMCSDVTLPGLFKILEFTEKIVLWKGNPPQMHLSSALGHIDHIYIYKYRSYIYIYLYVYTYIYKYVDHIYLYIDHIVN